jgi:hypothetical protein
MYTACLYLKLEIDKNLRIDVHCLFIFKTWNRQELKNRCTLALYI